MIVERIKYYILILIAGLLLWQWRRRRLRPLPRVALEAATIYFWAAVATGLIFNAIAAGLLGAIS